MQQPELLVSEEALFTQQVTDLVPLLPGEGEAQVPGEMERLHDLHRADILLSRRQPALHEGCPCGPHDQQLPRQGGCIPPNGGRSGPVIRGLNSAVGVQVHVGERSGGGSGTQHSLPQVGGEP